MDRTRTQSAERATKKRKAVRRSTGTSAAKDESDLPFGGRVDADDIIKAMNRVIGVLRVMAVSSQLQKRYEHRQATLELQKLDDRQYDTPRVMVMLGTAYYDIGNYATVSSGSCLGQVDTDLCLSLSLSIGPCVFPMGLPDSTLVL